MYEFKPSEEWLKQAAKDEELLDGHAGPLACSPGIYREMQMAGSNGCNICYGSGFTTLIEKPWEKALCPRCHPPEDEIKEIESTLAYARLVMPGDLNAANRLFGGEIMKWADEAAAMYAMCQLRTKRMVTLKVSEVLFKEPVCQGDLLEFWASTAKVGNSSFTVALKVLRKEIEQPEAEHATVLSCEFVFVTVDENGKAAKHRFAGVKE